MLASFTARNIGESGALMLIPGPRLLALIAALALGALATAIVPAFQLAWLLLAAACLIVACADALLVLRTTAPEARRIVSGTLALGVRREVVLDRKSTRLNSSHG